MHEVDPDTMQVRYMAVEPEFRGQGIGGEILRFMEETARNVGRRAIIMNARKAALNLYERAGYLRVSEEIMLHGIPHYRMEKQIS
jgi:predicted GNAT family N-acyltransferase